MRIAIAMLPFLLCALYLAGRAYAVMLHGYTWKEMDWNGDGTATVFEFFEASDIGKIAVKIEGKDCIEYFAYKDARPIRVDCP